MSEKHKRELYENSLKMVDDLQEKIESKDKVINDLLGRIANLEREVERLNNIINKLEEELRSDYTIWMCGARQNGKSVKFGIDVCKKHFYNRLQELKGSDKE